MKFIAVLLLLALLAGCRSSSDTTMYRQNIHNTGIITGQEAVADFHGVKWEYYAGNWIFSSPVYANGHIYFGDENSFINKMSLDGQLIWRFRTGNDQSLRATAAIHQRRIFIGNMGDKTFFAVDEGSGEQLWRYQAGGNIFVSPVIDDSTVFFACTAGNLYALNQADGASRWVTSFKSSIRSSPALDGDRLYFGSDDGTFYCADATTGIAVWSFNSMKADSTIDVRLTPKIITAAVIANGMVYFGSMNGNLYALDKKSGELRWMKHTGMPIQSTPAVDSENLYIGGWNRTFYCLNALDGSERWTREVPGRIEGSPSVCGTVVYFGDHTGILHALDTRNGGERWQYKTELSVVTTPLVVNGMVIFGNQRGYLYAIE